MKTHKPVTRITLLWISVSVLGGFILILSPGCEKEENNDFCPSTFKDLRDGQEYKAVKIGDQCWMKENLNVGTMINGDQDQTNNDLIEKYCYDNISDSCTKYGGLYQWNEMMQYMSSQGTQGICPEGWHIPTYDEWNILKDHLDGWDFGGGLLMAGGKMKSTGNIEDGTGLWFKPNIAATNLSGFTGLPGGCFWNSSEGGFWYLGIRGIFWSSSPSDGTTSWYLELNKNHGYAYMYDESKEHGFSVRCLKDAD